MLNKYLLILIFISSILISCARRDEPSLSLRTLFYAAMEVIPLDQRVLTGERISDPAGVVLPVLEMVILQSDNSLRRDCLYYRVPQRNSSEINQRGELFIIRNVMDKCVEEVLKSSKEKMLIRGDLAITLEEEIVRFSFRKLSSSVLHKENLNLFNKMSTTKLRVREMTRPWEISSDARLPQLIGSELDSYSLNKITICKSFSRECKPIHEDRCDLCRYGSVPVVDSLSCKDGITRICRVQEGCGGLGELACLRGFSFSKISMRTEACFEGSYSGYCQEKLHTACDENGFLRCIE